MVRRPAPPACSEASLPTPPFYIYPRLLSTALEVIGCLQADPRALNLSRSQFLADVDSLQVLLAHPSRTHERSQARLFVLPLLAEASRQAGRCHGRTHPMRQQEMLQATFAEVAFDAGPHLLACTCVMLRRLYGATLHQLLLNQSRRLVQLTKAPSTWDGEAGPAQAVVPYHTPAAFTADGCDAPRPHLAAFAGSLTTVRDASSVVRRRIAELSEGAPRLRLLATERRSTPGSSCAAQGACVDGFNAAWGSERTPRTACFDSCAG